MKYSIIGILVMYMACFAITSFAQETFKSPPLVLKQTVVLTTVTPADVPTPVKLQDLPTPVKLSETKLSPADIPRKILPPNAVSVLTTVEQSPKSPMPKTISPDRSATLLPSKPESIKPKSD